MWPPAPGRNFLSSERSICMSNSCAPINAWNSILLRWACHGFSKSNEGLYSIRSVSKDVFGRQPSAWFAEHDDRRSAKAEIPFLLSSLKLAIQPVGLHDPPNGHRSYLDESQTAEVRGFENLNVTLIAKQNVGL